MAITDKQQSDILKVVIGLFNAAPGKVFLTDFETQVEGGTTIAQLADGLAASTYFTDGVMGGKVTTADQVAVLMNNFGVEASKVITSAGFQADFFFTARIDAGVGFGAIIFEAITFLSDNVPPEFVATANLLTNKALVAEAYSASNSSDDLSILQNVLKNVTSTTPFTPADVAIIIASNNDTTAPVVTVPAANFNYTENQVSSTTVAIVAATDDIAVSNFQIVSGNDAGFFTIDPAGKITLTPIGLTSAANDFEVGPNLFDLTITAQDLAGNISTGQVVTIAITNDIFDDVSGGGGDTTAPTLSLSTPADNATGIAVGANLVLTFNEAIALSTGNIVLKKTSDDSTIETFNVATGAGDAGGTMTANGTGVTINPSADLVGNTGYYLTVAPTAVRDTAGNFFAGISSTTALNFTTAADAPIALVTLTTGPDVRTGGTGNDTLTGHIDQATPANTTLNAGDTISGGLGTDTLTLTTLSSTGSDLILADALFTGVTGFEVIVIGTTVSDNQVITAGAKFQAAFATDGIDLTTVTAAGNITIDMNSFPFTGEAIFRTTSVAGVQTITAGSGATTVISTSAAGNQTISGAGLANVTSVSTTGTQTITTGAGIAATVDATSSTGSVSVITSTLADSVNLTTADVSGAGNVINTGAGNDTITLDNGTAVTTLQNTITGGTGADIITLNANASKDVIVIGDTDSGITVATADKITNFTAADDSLKMGTAAASTGAPTTDNYVEAGGGVADFATALTAANIQLAALAAANTGLLEAYAFQFDATNGYLFNDIDGNGTADQVVVLVGIDAAEISVVDIIA